MFVYCSVNLSAFSYNIITVRHCMHYTVTCHTPPSFSAVNGRSLHHRASGSACCSTCLMTPCWPPSSSRCSSSGTTASGSSGRSAGMSSTSPSSWRYSSVRVSHTYRGLGRGGTGGLCRGDLHTRIHARTHAHTHTRTHAYTHTRIHARTLNNLRFII